ncbi:Exosome complex component rrp43 [Colletotrichum chlorophyti]|uniref:Ribosomal RNA-processing protein 43 n=1 Tax=Colletotrichum chlorophyti TaxID=708187 RepID=A0A1Q8S4X0_9PEZI|nr:Exosome complex component rrp43 [Colletotrichum chlorophyti]
MATSKGIPRDTFAKLSPHPFLLANLQPPAPANAARSNGRAPDEARIPNINTSSLTHANGSAVVRTGDTTVICGIRAETVLACDIPNFPTSANHAENRTSSELKDYDLLVPNIELATGCAPQFLPGVPPTTLAQTLSTRVYSLLHSSKLVDPENLRIWYTRPAETAEAEDEAEDDKMEEDDDDVNTEGEKVVIAYWVLYIDIFFISFDGNPFDAAWAAVLAALRDTTIPVARWDPDREMVICSRDNPRPLTLHGFPVACTAGVFTGKEASGKFWTLVDPDRLEESLCDEEITAVVLVAVCGHAATRAYVVAALDYLDEKKQAQDAPMRRSNRATTRASSEVSQDLNQTTKTVKRTIRICKLCEKAYEEKENTAKSCKFHDGHWLMECEKEGRVWFDPLEIAADEFKNNPDLVRILSCCNAEEGRSLGCRPCKHVAMTIDTVCVIENVSEPATEARGTNSMAMDSSVGVDDFKDSASSQTSGNTMKVDDEKDIEKAKNVGKSSMNAGKGKGKGAVSKNKK